MKLLFLLPAAVAALGVTHTDLMKMKDSLRSIALQAKKSGDPIDQATKDIVSNMTNQLNATIWEALDKDKDDAQTILDEALKAVNDCKTSRENTFTGDIASRESTKESSENEFHCCKGSDGACQWGTHQREMDARDVAEGHDYGYDTDRDWSTDATGRAAHELEAHADENRTCRILNNTVKNFVVKDQDQASWCFEAEVEQWDQIFAQNADTVAKSYEWFHYMDGWESENAADYFAQRSECHKFRDIHIETVKECTRLQHVFEIDYCHWCTGIDEACDVYDDCYVTNFKAWNETKVKTEAKETQFKAQQHALEMILCYSAEILSGSTDVSNCETDEHQTCKFCSPRLDINYEDPHGQLNCDEEECGSNKPCSAGWVQTNYGKYDGTDTPVDACGACPSSEGV